MPSFSEIKTRHNTNNNYNETINYIYNENLSSNIEKKRHLNKIDSYDDIAESCNFNDKRVKFDESNSVPLVFTSNNNSTNNNSIDKNYNRNSFTHLITQAKEKIKALKQPLFVLPVLNYSREKLISLTNFNANIPLRRCLSKLQNINRMNNWLSINLENIESQDFDYFTEIQKQYVIINEKIKEWLKFQNKWILWTLISYERKYPEKYLGILATKTRAIQMLNSRIMQYFYKNKIRQINTKCPNIMDSFSFENICNISKIIQLKTNTNSHLSPLQRILEIRTFLWPIIVCVCIKSNYSGIDL
jgi:predicted transcriptional regulator YdeE